MVALAPRIRALCRDGADDEGVPPGDGGQGQQVRSIARMPPARARRRLVALGLVVALGVIAGCGSGASSPDDRTARTRDSDELPASLDNGRDRKRDFDGELHLPPKQVCDDRVHETDRSLVVRVLPDGPRAPDGDLAFRSGVCVYLPPGYESGDLRYPVLYLLHGAAGNAADAVVHGLRRVMDRRIEADPDAAAIVVMPDGHDAQWYDAIDGRIRNETYVAGYVVPFVDERFRTIAKRAGRAVTGVSNGGYGAMLLATKHPKLFGAAGGMSANLDWLGARGLGDPSGEYYRANHPLELADRLADTDVVLDIAARCTSTDPAERCESQGLDATFLPANRAFDATLRQLPDRTGAFEYREGDGAHRWRTWIRWLEDHQLPFFADHQADPRPTRSG